MAILYRTGHEINQRVCDALAEGFPGQILATYGILRGSGEWALRQRWLERAVLMADRGYFRPIHYDGYYRLSFEGTQAQYQPEAAVDERRWRALGLEIEPWKHNAKGHVLFCPPTKAVVEFYGIGPDDWYVYHAMRAEYVANLLDSEMVVRHKGCAVPLDEHLKGCRCVVTFNSGVGWEALRRGIPCISDVRHSTVGSFLGTTIADLGRDLTDCDRVPLFSFMANRQFTLAEISTGIARSYIL
jgi:hypothetical protein